MAKQEYFPVYLDKCDMLALLDDAQRGRLFLHLANYAAFGDNPPAEEDRIVLVAFTAMRAAIDASQKKQAESAARCARAAKKRWDKERERREQGGGTDMQMHKEQCNGMQVHADAMQEHTDAMQVHVYHTNPYHTSPFQSRPYQTNPYHAGSSQLKPDQQGDELDNGVVGGNVDGISGGVIV